MHNNSGIQDAEIGRKSVATDTKFYILHVVVLCGLGSLTAYCVYYGDVNRILIGYDNYGNICGKETIVQDDTKLLLSEGLDLKLRPYLLVFRPDERNNYTYNATFMGVWILEVGAPKNLSTDISRVCVANCRMYPYYVRFKKRCILKKRKGVWDRFFGTSGHPNIFIEVAEDLYLCWKLLVYLGLGSSALSFVIMVLLSIFTRVMVWLILNIAVLLSLTFTVYMWFLFVHSKQIINQPEYLASELELERNRTYLAFALIDSFIIIYLISIILSNRKKLELVIELFKEVIKSIKAMRLLLLQPVLTCMFIFVTISAWIYAVLWIEASGYKTIFNAEYLVYTKDSWNYLARWYNIFVSLWMIRFLVHCQHMIVARAVSFWYFRKNKNKLGIPIFYGFYSLVSYHLATVSLGSLLTLLIELPRMILIFVQKFFKGKEEKFSCLSYIHLRDNILKYFTTDAYVEVVICGYPFRTAGRKAFAALGATDFDVASIKGMGCFVLDFAHILVCTASMLAATAILQKEEDLLHMWVIIILTGTFAYFVSTSFFSLFKFTNDTIFICFCEDYSNHDGVFKPYYMSKQFLQLVQNLDNSLDVDKSRNRIQT